MCITSALLFKLLVFSFKTFSCMFKSNIFDDTDRMFAFFKIWINIGNRPLRLRGSKSLPSFGFTLSINSHIYSFNSFKFGFNVFRISLLNEFNEKFHISHCLCSCIFFCCLIIYSLIDFAICSNLVDP